MPWTAEDAKQKNSKLTDDQAKKWARMANKILASCEKRGKKDCEKIAISTASKYFASKRVT